MLLLLAHCVGGGGGEGKKARAETKRVSNGESRPVGGEGGRDG